MARWTTSLTQNPVVTTAYSGNQVTVADQVNKVRRSVSDGLDGLKQVVEDSSGSLPFPELIR